MRKSDKVTILDWQFQVTKFDNYAILGRGDDGKIYSWSYIEGAWYSQWAGPDEKKALKTVLKEQQKQR